MAELEDIRKVRLLTADLDATPIVDDTTVQDYLDLNDGAVYLAAADVLDAMATSETLLGKKIRTASGQSTDGPAVAAELRGKAQSLRAKDAELQAGGGFLEFYPSTPTGSGEGVETRLW